MVPTKVKQSPRSLARVLFRRQFVSVLQVTPALIRQFSESEIVDHLLGPESHVRVLAFGGEACPTLDTLAQWKSPKVNNMIYMYHSNYKVTGLAGKHNYVHSSSFYKYTNL